MSSQGMLHFQANRITPVPRPMECLHAGGGSQDRTDWQLLSSAVLPSSLQWFAKDGMYAPRNVEGLIDAGEAVCAALNLYRCILLRELKDGTNLTGVSK